MEKEARKFKAKISGSGFGAGERDITMVMSKDNFKSMKIHLKSLKKENFICAGSKLKVKNYPLDI